MKKTIILCGINTNNQKAVMNLERAGDKYKGDFRLYGTQGGLDGIISVGILSEGKVEKCVASGENEFFYTFDLITKKDLKKFTVALVQTKGGETKPIFVGSFGGNVDNTLQTRLMSCKELFDENVSVKSVEKALDKKSIFYEDSLQKEIENEIDKQISFTEQNDDCDKALACKTCRYKKVFYEEENLKTNKNEKSESSFYNSILPQLEKLFDDYERDFSLESIVPNSKWVKVDYFGDGNYYVLGVVGDGEKVNYVCYGVPGVYSVDPPKEFEGLCKWLPLSDEKPFENGYWVVYQNAETGENENIEVI